MRRRGSFLMVLLVAMPLMLMGMSLAADYSRSVLVTRQLADTAEAAVMAGATGFSDTVPGTLDPDEAIARARAMVSQAELVRMLTVPNVKLDGVQMRNGNITIVVEMSAEVPMIIPSLFARMVGAEPLFITAGVVRDASVCQPTNPGGCTYPTNDY